MRKAKGALEIMSERSRPVVSMRSPSSSARTVIRWAGWGRGEAGDGRWIGHGGEIIEECARREVSALQLLDGRRRGDYCPATFDFGERIVRNILIVPVAPEAGRP